MTHAHETFTQGIGGYTEWAENDFHNSSVEVGYNLSISIHSFSSTASTKNIMTVSGSALTHQVLL
jgi:hypothetical protein